MKATDQIIVRRLKVRRKGMAGVDRSLAFILPAADEADVRESRAIKWPVRDKREVDRVFRRLVLAAEDAVEAGATVEFIAEIRALARGEFTSPTSGSDERLGPGLAEFKSEFIERHAEVNNKPSEIESKLAILRRHLIPALGHLRLGEIRRREIDAYKADKLKAGLKPGTVNNHLGVLSKMLKTAVTWELIDNAPPVGLLKNPKPPFDFLDFDEADRLLAAADPEPSWWNDDSRRLAHWAPPGRVARVEVGGC